MLDRFGYRLQRMSVEELGYARGYDSSVPLPIDAEGYLRPDHPRLLDLERRYAEVDSPICEHTQWRGALRSAHENLRYFRGENEYVWHYARQNGRTAAHAQMRLRYYVYARYVRELDERGLLGNRLDEDGLFGCFTFRYPRIPTISRDLLDSINEIYFLGRHWGLFERKGARVLDVGAGYGRLAHRMLMGIEGVSQYACVDAIPRSTYICEYYLRFRGLLDGDEARATVICLDELTTSVARGTFDLAVNIHGFSEMSHAAIAAWLERLVDLEVPWLFVVPNEPEMLSRERAGTRREYRGLIEDAGYRLEITEPTIRDPDVRELYGIGDHFFLFQRT